MATKSTWIRKKTVKIFTALLSEEEDIFSVFVKIGKKEKKEKKRKKEKGIGNLFFSF